MKGILLALLLFSFRSYAQDMSVKATTEVPFNFVVNSVTLPAGTYEIRIPYWNKLMLKNEQTRQIVYASTADVALQEPAPGSKLVFRRDSDRTVLHQVVLMSHTHKNDLIHSKDVIELASE